MEKLETGNFGEKIAAEYLSGNGFVIIMKNYRLPGGEIDIIARAPDGTLVFVEVKTMRKLNDGLIPEDQITAAKRKKMKRAAQLFANSHVKLLREDRGWRVDVIVVELAEQSEIRHYTNV